MKYIFCCGNSRSGTTFLANLFGNLDKVHVLQEVHFFERITIEPNSTLDKAGEKNTITQLVKSQNEGYLANTISNNTLAETNTLLQQKPCKLETPNDAYRYFLDYYLSKTSSDKIVEQTPRNQFYSDEIKKVFGDDSLLVYIYRDPRDVLLSQKNKWKLRKLGASKKIPLRESIRAWSNYIPFLNLILWRSGIRNFLSSTNFELSFCYETLVNQPEIELEKIFDYFQLPFDQTILDIPIYSSSHTTKGQTGISNKSVGRWKKELNQAEIVLTEMMCHKEMDVLGYSRQVERLFSTKNYLLILFFSILYVPKLGITFCLNISKYKNPFDTLLKRVKS